MTADLLYALRKLRRAPGFALTAVLTLALGIGATTAIFTLVYQVMLRSLPVAHPEQLYKVGREIDCCVTGGLQSDWNLFSFDLYRYLRDRTPSGTAIAAMQSGAITVSVHRAGDAASAQPLALRFVSGNYFSVLGVRTFAGRLLSPGDDREGAPPVAVLSYAIWQAKFAADPHLVGKTLLLGGRPVTVAGITAPGFLGDRSMGDPPGIWIPLALEPQLDANRTLVRFPGSHWLDLLARVPDPKLVPAVQLALQGELRQWLAANRQAAGDNVTDSAIAHQTTELAPAPDGINELRDGYGSSLKLLQLLAGFVLLIACANLAGLLLVRGMGRKQELAVRSALGAPRGRLIRQTLAEAVLLSLAGGIAALAFAALGTRAILALAMKGAEVNPIATTPSAPVLGFALAVALATGLLFGIVPAWITSRANPAEALRGANRSTRDRSARPQKALVVVQAALSLALLSVAGLLITSFRQLTHQDFRFEPEGRLILFTDLTAAGYDYDRLAGLYQRFDNAFIHMPGLDSYAYATYGPMAFNNWSSHVFFPGVAAASIGPASYSAISPRYFETIGTRLLLGRSISERDTDAAAHVAVVNKTFADRFFPGKQPIGQHFGMNPTNHAQYEIVGIVEDTKYGSPKEPARPMFFSAMAQTLSYADPDARLSERFIHSASNVVFHYHGDEQAMTAAIRRTLKDIDPAIPITQLLPYREQLNNNFTTEILTVRLTTLFGLLALGLAALGLYGVTAYSVARRTSEIGIRMALGASRAGVVRMVLRGALTQALLGLALGLPIALGSGRLLAHSLYQTSPFQPLVLGAVAVLLLLAALIAALIPARRAASIDPITALRTE